MSFSACIKGVRADRALPRDCGMQGRLFRNTLRALAYAGKCGMKAETWLVRCAAELQHLYLMNPNRKVNDVPLDDWNMDTAGELIEAQRYRGLDPVQAARSFWRDSMSSPQQR